MNRIKMFVQMKKSAIVLVNIGYWACYLILIGVILAMIYGTRESVEDSQIEGTFITIIFFALLPSILAFYSFYFFIFPRFNKQQNIFGSILMALSFALFAGYVGFFILNKMFEGQCLTGSGEGASDPFELTIFIAFIALISGIIALVIRGFITWFNEIKLKDELKQKNHEMEMALVKSQLDPHFLFNTINNIDVLIIKNAEEASDYLNKLSDIMRFMLFETKADEIMLSKEVEYINKYIELQKIRTSNSNYISFTLEGQVGGRVIAPMIFIPFIENAFKHTTNKKLENAISICILIKEESICLVCENKIDPNRKLLQESNGLGNELIMKRLNLIYPKQHLLEVENKDNLYSVHLTIYNGKV